MYTHTSVIYGGDNHILQPNWFLKKSGSGNRIYRNSMQCVQNQTQQLVGNDVFKHVSELCLFCMCYILYQIEGHVLTQCCQSFLENKKQRRIL